MNTDDVLPVLLQGKLRQQLLLSLHQPHTIGQLSKKLDVPLDLCKKGMHFLRAYQLVTCLTPYRTRHRMYWLTQLGADCQEGLLQHHNLEKITHAFPELDYAAYAALAAPSRGAMVASLTFPMRAMEVKKKLIVSFPKVRMTGNYARETLRHLVRLGVVEREFAFDRTYSRFRLSATGRLMRNLLLGAEDQPCLGLSKI